MSFTRVITAAYLVCAFLASTLSCQNVVSQPKYIQPPQQGVSEDQWKKLIDPEGDFSILFPGKVEHQSDQIEVAHIKGIARHSYSSNYEGCAFGFSYFRIPIKTEDGYRRIMKSTQAQTIRQNIQLGWQLMNQQILPENGYQTDWSVPTNGIMTYMRLRQYYRSSRAYSIAFNSYELKDLDGELSTRFFESLQFKNAHTSK